MFTGIIEKLGEVESIEVFEKGLQCRIVADLDGVSIGDSVSVNGVCLTVTEIQARSYRFDISPETLNKTSLLNLKKGTDVHLETASTLQKPLGGHLVLGHVDGVVTISEIEKNQQFYRVVFKGVQSPQYLVSKGSIALDGVSLTINEIGRDGFECMLVPHTLEKTLFNRLSVGDKVNVEYDYFAKIIHKQIKLYMQNNIHKEEVN